MHQITAFLVLDGVRLVVACENGHVAVGRVHEREHRFEPETTERAYTSAILALAPLDALANGAEPRFASASEDGSIYVWTLRRAIVGAQGSGSGGSVSARWTPRQVASFRRGVVPCALARLDNGFLAVGCRDGTVHVQSAAGSPREQWSFAQLALAHAPRTSARDRWGGVNALAALPWSGALVSGGEDGLVHTWMRVRDGQMVARWSAQSGSAVRALEPLVDAEFASGHADGRVRVWDRARYTVNVRASTASSFAWEELGAMRAAPPGVGVTALASCSGLATAAGAVAPWRLLLSGTQDGGVTSWERSAMPRYELGTAGHVERLRHVHGEAGADGVVALAPLVRHACASSGRLVVALGPLSEGADSRVATCGLPSAHDATPTQPVRRVAPTMTTNTQTPCAPGRTRIDDVAASAFSRCVPNGGTRPATSSDDDDADDDSDGDDTDDDDDAGGTSAIACAVCHAVAAFREPLTGTPLCGMGCYSTLVRAR